MIRWSKPFPDTIQDAIDRVRDAPLTYDHVTGTRNESCPRGFTDHRFSERIGRGNFAFQTAKRAIHSFAPLNQGWMTTFPQTPTFEPGQHFATVVRVPPLWVVNVARIVDVIEVDSERSEYGFAYGTTSEYMLSGEERITVTWDRRSDDVSYHVYSFAKPNTLLASLGHFYIARLRSKFCCGGAKQVQDYVVEHSDRSD